MTLFLLPPQSHLLFLSLTPIQPHWPPLFLRCTKHTPTLGPLYLLFPLSERQFAHIFTNRAPLGFRSQLKGHLLRKALPDQVSKYAESPSQNPFTSFTALINL